MILIDFSGICVAGMFSQKNAATDEDLLRHIILNSLRMYNVKFRAKYGKMVICCDGGSWRKKVFAEYKGARKTSRDESPIDWDNVWRVLNMVRDEILEHLPYKVVQLPGAEADDVIAALVESTQEFGCAEDCMIVSSDHDMIQLQKYSNVSQFSPMTKKLVVDKNPRKYLMEQVLRGCGGDGVPNVLSDDDTFLNSAKRQTPLRKNVLENWIKNYSKLNEIMEPSVYKNFLRNQACIDFAYIPEEISSAILKIYNEQAETPNSKVFNYLITKRCKMLVSSAQEFFTTTK